MQHSTFSAMSAYVHFLLALLLIATLCESKSNSFQVDTTWKFFNFTWPSSEAYHHAISTQEYIPDQVMFTGIKIWKDRMYICMPRLRKGVPMALAWFSSTNSPQSNPLLSPLWNQSTNFSDCNELQSVQSMEIDTKGIMWVLDGYRLNSITKCPTKLVLIDLEKEPPKIIHSFTFPEEMSLSQGGFLNDIVIDEDGGNGVHAYITDTSTVDPGLIVFSRQKNRAWKLRDSSMFAEKGDNYSIIGYEVAIDAPIDGVALSPASKNEKTIYYCSLNGKNLYAIKANIAKNETLITSGGKWREEVQLIGKMQAQSDGLMIDNEGNLFYGLLPLYGVGAWNTKNKFSTAKIIAKDRNTFIWPGSFAFDTNGYLYLLSNKFLDPMDKLNASNDVNFSILKMYTGKKSYLYSKD